MTQRSHGALGGCRYTIVTDPDTGEEVKYLCLECQNESEPSAESFLQMRAHRCPRPRLAAATPTPPPDGPVPETTPSPKLTRAAAALVEEHGLSADEILVTEPSGASGDYTVTDVRAILSTKE